MGTCRGPTSQLGVQINSMFIYWRNDGLSCFQSIRLNKQLSWLYKWLLGSQSFPSWSVETSTGKTSLESMARTWLHWWQISSTCRLVIFENQLAVPNFINESLLMDIPFCMMHAVWTKLDKSSKSCYRWEFSITPWAFILNLLEVPSQK